MEVSALYELEPLAFANLIARLAQKLRAAIIKELEVIQRGGQGTNEIARFEKVEKLMEK